MLKQIKKLFNVGKGKIDYKKKYYDVILEVRQVEEDHMIFVRQVEAVLKEERERRIGNRIGDPAKITGVPRV
jgi:ribosomal protein S24E